MRARRQLLWILALVLSALLVAAVYRQAARQGSADLLARGAQQLQLMAPELESALEKFETLPYVLGLQHNVLALLDDPGNAALAAELNRNLQAVQRQSKVYAIFLMDRHGQTLGASNWNMPLSFVGKNFQFRPYFRDAMNGKAGRFYGIGSATREPGYFLAQPVMRGGQSARHRRDVAVGGDALGHSCLPFCHHRHRHRRNVGH